MQAVNENVRDPAAPAATGPAPGSGQYLTFLLSGEVYGVDILRVQEIKGWDGVTRVPHTPSFLLGVMNLRGTVVPVVDLRSRFGLERQAFGPSNVVIVVRVRAERGDKTVGLAVDGVSDVHDFAADDIRPPPQVQHAGRAVISGLASAAERLVMLLDVERLVVSSLEADLRVGRHH
jgi:purine-binding chemotaxis protein CheW